MEKSSHHAGAKAQTTAPEATSATEPMFSGQPGAPHPRTFGLKAFDAFLYPGIAYWGVFATSVFFTYLTNRGSHFGKEGSNARAFGKLMEKRGDWIQGHLMNAGLSEKAAANWRMVFWSFADGSLLAPVIKGFEDNRENIARKIDRIAHTEPDDPIVYSEEPRQSWGSVLGARALTAGIVVPVAAALETKNAAGKSVNDRWFYDPGLKVGQYVRKAAPVFSARFSEGTFREISKVTLFEGFYTGVCILGQYFISRAIARATDKRQPANLNAAPITDETNVVRLSSLMQSPEAKPDTKITDEDRAAEPLQARSAEVSA